jgi:hypothetical protein
MFSTLNFLLSLPGLYSFNNGEISDSTTKDSTINIKRSNNLAPMSSSLKCLDVINLRILADSERLIVKREA